MGVWTVRDLPQHLRDDPRNRSALHACDAHPPEDEVHLVLPWPPSKNQHRLLPTSHGKLRYAPVVKAYMVHAEQRILEQRQGRGPLTGPLLLLLIYHPPTLRRVRDSVLNYTLDIPDCLTRMRVWGDDSQVKDFRATEGLPSDPAYVEVIIRHLTGAEGGC
jgi:Holliday junction resolvase RusA-like endonuclease